MFTKTVCARERQQYARAYVHGSRSTSGSTTGVVIAAMAVAFLWDTVATRHHFQNTLSQQFQFFYRKLTS